MEGWTLEIPPRFAADACPRCRGGRLFPDLDGAKACVNCGHVVRPEMDVLDIPTPRRAPRLHMGREASMLREAPTSPPEEERGL